MGGAAIDTVVFDLGNVVVGWDPYLPFTETMTREEWQQLAEESGFSELNLRADSGVAIRELVAEAAERNRRYGEMVAQYYERFAQTLLGPVPGTAEIIQSLKAQGIRVLGLTNWSAETFPHGVAKAPAISELEAVVVSGEEGLVKPDPAIFHLITERYGLTPSRTVFVDDSAANVASAAELGFKALRFTDAVRLREDLAGLGLAVPVA